MRRIRAAARLGFFCGLAALAACAVPNRALVAERADRAQRTGVYAWLSTHRPAALVAAGRGASLPDVAAIVAPAPVRIAGTEPCAQAKSAHAAVLFVGAASPAAEALLGCGAVLYRDAGGFVVAPL